jgi:hypothetical protein
MQTHTAPKKVSEVVNSAIKKFMMATGIFAYVWILAFLLVGMIDK